MARDIAGETVIVPVRDNVGDLDSIFTLNEMGAAIWRMIDGRTAPAEIVAALCAEYDVAGDEAAKDVAEFLGSLQAAGLITQCDEP